jgi:hypothetical protein
MTPHLLHQLLTVAVDNYVIISTKFQTNHPELPVTFPIAMGSLTHDVG